MVVFDLSEEFDMGIARTGYIENAHCDQGQWIYGIRFIDSSSYISYGYPWWSIKVIKNQMELVQTVHLYMGSA